MLYKTLSYFLVLISLSASATQATLFSDQDIQHIYQTVLSDSRTPIANRVEKISHYFLGRPYQEFTLGEGPEGIFDQRPLYRTDSFNCETFVETVLALAESNNSDQFKNNVLEIRYAYGKPSYFSRNHFASVEWNKHNEEKKYIRDITPYFTGYQRLTTVIDKPHWYQKRNRQDIYLSQSPSPKKYQALIQKLHQASHQVKPEVSQLNYLPFSALFNREGRANTALFNKIPSGSIVQMVYGGSSFRKEIGTDLDISHMGLAIREKGVLYYRAASNLHGMQIVDLPLEDYLRAYFEISKSYPMVGIHIEQITLAS